MHFRRIFAHLLMSTAARRSLLFFLKKKENGEIDIKNCEISMLNVGLNEQQVFDLLKRVVLKLAGKDSS